MKSYFNCVFTSTTIYEACCIGIITLILGKIAIYLTFNENDRKEHEKKYKDMNIILFLIGFTLHFIIEMIGLNKWYCDGKKCVLYS